MRHLSTLLAASLSALAGAASHDALVYTFDSENPSPSSHSTSVSPDAARLILSRRLRSSRSSQLGDVSEDVVESLNRFGGRQSPLLGALPLEGAPEELENMARLLVVWEGVENKAGMFGGHVASIDLV
jgi:hypothetical protein